MKLNHNIKFETPLRVIHYEDTGIQEKLDRIITIQNKILAKVEKLSPPDFSEQIKKLDEIIQDVKTTI